VPDFGDTDSRGVKFADVRNGSPAAKAGLKKDDLLMSFDGKPIKNLYDFTFALQAKQPGDKVEVIVLRQGKEVKATVELTNRP
jgi:S1-C subfamily serine protease